MMTLSGSLASLRRLEAVTPPREGTSPMIEQPVAPLGASFGERPTRRRGSRMGEPDFELAQFMDVDEILYECGVCRKKEGLLLCGQCSPAFYICEECMFGPHFVHDSRHTFEVTPPPPSAALGKSVSKVSDAAADSFGSEDSLASSAVLYDPCRRCFHLIRDSDNFFKCNTCPGFIVCESCGKLGAQPQNHDPSHVFTMIPRSVCVGRVREARVASVRREAGRKVINQYVCVKLLGRGAYGKVKLIQHVQTHELLALKIMNKSSLQRMRTQDGETAFNQALREIAVMKVIHHPNVVDLVEVIDDPDSNKLYVIMEYMANGQVHDWGQPPLPVEKVRRYGGHALDGLLYLHSQVIYHRDVKPANLLLSEDDVAKLADFGVSQTRGGAVNSTSGTPGFLSPEQVAGDNVDGAHVDAWAFGITLFVMAFGRLPYSGSAGQTLQELFAQISAPAGIFVPIETDRDLRSLLCGLLERDPAKRLSLAAAQNHPFFGNDGANVARGLVQKRPAALTRRITNDDLGPVIVCRRVERHFAAANVDSHAPTHSEQQTLAALDVESDSFSAMRMMGGQGSPFGAATRSSIRGMHGRRGTGSNGVPLGGGGGQSPTASATSAPAQAAIVSPMVCSGLPGEARSPETGTPLSSPRTRSDVGRLTSGGSMANMSSPLSPVMRKKKQAPSTLKLVFDSQPVDEYVLNLLVHSEPQEVVLRRNGFTDLSDLVFDHPAKLTTMKIEFNDLTEFPSCILTCFSLTRLSLTGNSLDTLPDELGTLAHLEALCLSKNCFEDVPIACTRAPSLRQLDLTHNPVHDLPEHITQFADVCIVLDNAPGALFAWQSEFVGKARTVSIMWNCAYPSIIANRLLLGTRQMLAEAARLAALDVCVVIVPELPGGGAGGGGGGPSELFTLKTGDTPLHSTLLGPRAPTRAASVRRGTVSTDNSDPTPPMSPRSRLASVGSEATDKGRADDSTIGGSTSRPVDPSLFGAMDLPEGCELKVWGPNDGDADFILGHVSSDHVVLAVLDHASDVVGTTLMRYLVTHGGIPADEATLLIAEARAGNSGEAFE